MNKRYFPETQNIHPDAKLGDGCVFHSHVWIGKGVVIGDDSKVQAFAFIPDGVTLGRGVFIGPHVCFTNDRHPKAQGAWEESKTIVEDGASIGANATIVAGVTIGAGATVGAGAVVTHNVPAGETWVGNPARRLSRLTTEIQKEVGC